MLTDYFHLGDSGEKRIFISNLLHDIKYEKDIGALYEKYGIADWSGISDGDRLLDSCILATYVEQAFHSRGLSAPDWVRDKRLILETPHFIGFKAPDLVLHATQACLNHNVFMSRGDFEVV